MSELLRRTLGEVIQVETVLSGGLWRSFVDPGQLENSILNLAVNARDAMPSDGKLTIETANTDLDERYASAHDEVTAGQCVMVSVTDTGTGMTPDIIERAFDPFYTTKGVGKGTGLGLSQVFGLSNNTAATSKYIRKLAMARRSSFTCPAILEPRQKRRPLPLPMSHSSAAHRRFWFWLSKMTQRCGV
jgi:hypothetical protein